MLKHLPKNALKMIEKDLLYSKKPVIILGNEDRRSHNNSNEAFRIDANIEDREYKFFPTKLIQNTCTGSL